MKYIATLQNVKCTKSPNQIRPRNWSDLVGNESGDFGFMWNVVGLWRALEQNMACHEWIHPTQNKSYDIELTSLGKRRQYLSNFWLLAGGSRQKEYMFDPNKSLSCETFAWDRWLLVIWEEVTWDLTSMALAQEGVGRTKGSNLSTFFHHLCGHWSSKERMCQCSSSPITEWEGFVF